MESAEVLQQILQCPEIANVDAPKVEGTKLEEIDTTNPGVMKAQIIIRGLGGKENIEEVDSCMTRLRVNVKDMSLIDELDGQMSYLEGK